MTTDSPDLDRLDALARAATDGPWVGGHRRGGIGFNIDNPLTDDGLARAATQSDAEYIAATDPPTVLALIAELRNLRRWKAEAMPVLDGLQELGQALGIGLGKRITGREAVDAALDLRNAALATSGDTGTSSRPDAADVSQGHSGTADDHSRHDDDRTEGKS